MTDGYELQKQIDLQIKKRKALIESFPKVIEEKSSSLGLSSLDSEKQIKNGRDKLFKTN